MPIQGTIHYVLRYESAFCDTNADSYRFPSDSNRIDMNRTIRAIPTTLDSVEHLLLGFAQHKRFGKILFRDFQISEQALKSVIESIRGCLINY
ncbi:hypothetical protein RIF29_19375 [Crotalaria pallida]|uniref:Uncharacterized protein n=1 Tax=Crotalaria pallida TaxID=3830 RepID=A0AAN9I6G3_CROPI